MDDPRQQPPEGDDGVDVTLIRWMLSLTPRERLDVLDSAMDAMGKLRGIAAPR